MLATEWRVVRTSVDPIPCGDSTYRDAGYIPTASVSRLADLKARVPECIARKGRRAWELAILASAVPRPILPKVPAHVVSRAYHKLREIMLSCSLPRVSKSLHLGEAPGGFVQATAQHSTDSWTWTAVSLDKDGAPKPNVEHLPLECGSFLPGDVLDDDCMQDMLGHCGCKVDFVTADGAVEMNHDRLEEEHLPLLFGQSDVAMSALALEGVFVCKFFEGSLYETKVWIAGMSERFQHSCLIKPMWSRSTNSERYFVGRGFYGDASPIPRMGRLSGPWLEDLTRILDRICDDQSAALEAAFGVANKRSVHP